MATPAERHAASRERQSEPKDPELASFRGLYGFGFDDFQLEACRALGEGRGVLVAAPTGSGKTVVGEYAVHLALAQGRKCFYTTPIKALSNQKYADLVRRYDAATVGLLTGDNSINGDAPVVVMTTEVLRNMLYTGSAALAGLGYVVLDEVHYLADRSRGAVWEEVIIHLPESVLVAALSATVSNAEEFGDWLDGVRGGTTVIVDERRPVPLWQHVLVGHRLYDLFIDDEHARVNPELLRVAQRDTWIERKAPVRPGRGGRRPRRVPLPYRPDVVSRLDNAGLLPAITFIFSRAGCDAAVQQCLNAGLRLTTPEEAQAIQQTAERRTADIPKEDLDVLGYGEWLEGLRRGIAAHHAGMLPAFKEVVEELFAAGLVQAVFATETLALGINMPARTVVIEKLDKWNGETHANLTAGEYTQLTGRAGRRGIDVEGHAVVLWQPGMDPSAVAGLASTRTYPLNSSFRPSYNMAVNLTGWAGRERASRLLESSFAQFQADRGVTGLARQIRKNHQAMAELAAAMTCEKGNFAEYAEIRSHLSEREGDLSRARATSRRAEAARSLSLLRPGDIIRVPGGRRAGLAVVLQRGLHPAPRPDPAAAGGPGPLVLTEGRQVKRLSLADFPVPAEVIDKIRIPGSFSPRSPQHRRDLIATLRNRVGRASPGERPPGTPRSSGEPSPDSPPGEDLASHARDGDSRTRRGDRARGGAASDPGDEVAELRRRMRRHPCHDCPDREDHARYAGRYRRLKRETDDLERRMAGRSHVIARTFDRVCAVLERLGYLAGDTVTAEGHRLASLYNERDLLAAECMRLRLWDGLNPAELAACVSALSFESRQPDDPHPPRLPKGRVPEALAAMVRIWGELDQLEKDNELSFLREPDLGFAWAAYRWARGDSLESVLDGAPDLTPGDFVRSVKQLIDLLDQIAAAPEPSERAPVVPPEGSSPRGPALSATARAAIDAMRRGVVAYSIVAD
ncbi:MAG TPA: DEAD/DEAH box helicase [Streptosporangiaceae bacterium]|nr:DEAD/DEAH box helicase [Streptosporangiaceae bacterium]